MKNNFSHGPLIRFLLYPLIFTMNYAYKGVIAGIGILLIYPFLSMIVDFLKKKMRTADVFYLTSFFGVLCGILYILIVGMVDWNLYKELALVFPASMTASAMLIGLFEHEEHESAPFIEALLIACLVVFFSCIRDFLSHGTLDFRFGEFGVIYTFGTETSFEEYAVFGGFINNIWFSSMQLRAISFFLIAGIIASMGISSKRRDKK